MKVYTPCNFFANSYQYIGWLLTDNVMNNPSQINDPAIIPPSADGSSPGNVLSYLTGDALNGLATLILNIGDWGSNNNDGAFFDEDITSNQLTVYRLREGIERFLITDINNPAATTKAQSSIFVMYDDVSGNVAANFNHVPGGGNVLYMDGHVSFIKYPSESPFSRFYGCFISYALTQ
jgi:prepilin-type processing-associated H-X9-DG protein